MNEEYIRQLVKNTFEEQISEEIKKHLDSGIIFKYISDIENELQSYKDKEEKLRELCAYYLRVSFPTIVVSGKKDMCKEFLQILNEGSDK